MNRHRWLIYIFATGALAFSPHLSAANVTLVSSSKNKIYLLINEGIRQTLKTEADDVYLSDNPEPGSNIDSGKTKLVIAIGNTATLWAQKNVKDIPVTASGVILMSNPRELRDVTGVRLDFPIASYLKLVRDYLPYIKSVGMIYNGSMGVPYSQSDRKYSEDMGLQIIPVPVKRENEISGALQTMKDKGVESFLATYDSMVMNSESIKFIVDFCIQNRIALIVPSKALLKSGGLLSLEADYVELGRQTGLLIDRLLKNIDTPERNSLEIPQKSEVGINLKMAEVLNIRFKESVTNGANYLYR